MCYILHPCRLGLIWGIKESIFLPPRCSSAELCWSPPPSAFFFWRVSWTESYSEIVIDIGSLTVICNQPNLTQGSVRDLSEIQHWPASLPWGGNTHPRPGAQPRRRRARHLRFLPWVWRTHEKPLRSDARPGHSCSPPQTGMESIVRLALRFHVITGENSKHFRFNVRHSTSA